MSEKVFFSVSMSLDGFIAPESPEELMGKLWMELQQWAFRLRFSRANLKLGEGGEEGRDNDIARATFERTGASVMGKRMFDAGEQMWPEEAPFHTPVFVLTHEERPPQQAGGCHVERAHADQRPAERRELLGRELLERSAGERSKTERRHRQFVLPPEVIEGDRRPDPEADPERDVQHCRGPDRGRWLVGGRHRHGLLHDGVSLEPTRGRRPGRSWPRSSSISNPSWKVPSGPRSYARMMPTGANPTAA